MSIYTQFFKIKFSLSIHIKAVLEDQKYVEENNIYSALTLRLIVLLIFFVILFYFLPENIFKVNFECIQGRFGDLKCQKNVSICSVFDVWLVVHFLRGRSRGVSRG